MKLLMIAAMAATMTAAPALAKPGLGNGHGNNHAHGNQQMQKMHQTHEMRDMREDGQRGPANGCPPGLMKKNNGCTPPGLAKRDLEAGKRLPNGYQYNQVPANLMGTFPTRDGFRYIYSNGHVYEVNPTTSQIIGDVTPRM